MKNYKYTIIQDGTILKNDIKEKFNRFMAYRDVRSNKKGDYVNFVGFILTNNDALISFPKHFFSEKELIKINQSPENIDLYTNMLYKIIQISISSNNVRLLQVRQELNQFYPFNAFLRVYEYYIKYGLFTRKNEVKELGYNGKILWKDTLRKSPLIINEGNILYWPPVIQKYTNDYVFVTKCMTYVINSTINRFPFLLKFHQIPFEYGDVNFKNRKNTIRKLNSIKQYLFKDIHIQLVDNLIRFFMSDSHIGTHLEIKIYSFHLIWEELIGHYLNKYFLTMRDTDGEIIFSKSNDRENDFQEREFDLDARRKIKGMKTYKIKPDYYFDTEAARYIFDAKYYTAINELDYKQISYYFLLKWYQNECQNKGIYNILFLPTSGLSERNIHFQLDNEYSEVHEDFKILECYLNMQEMIKTYLFHNLP